MRLITNTRIETGRLTTPSGVDYVGFKVTIGSMLDPASVTRTYDDIEAILHQNKVEYKTHEEHRPDGKFKSYTVST
mgnify:FL=1